MLVETDPLLLTVLNAAEPIVSINVAASTAHHTQHSRADSVKVDAAQLDAEQSAFCFD
jgi:hypothetical protein